MTKIGVGVGEDFPIDDKSENKSGDGPHRGAGGYRRDEGSGRGWGCGPDDYEDWRERRAEWRAQRRAWRRRYREEMRMRHGPGDPYYYYWGLPRILRIVLVVAVIMLTFRLIADAPIIILGAALLAVLYVVHRRHEEETQCRRDVPPPPSGGN